MPTEILLYSSIFSFTAETFIEKMEAASGEDIVLRINTSGGDISAGFGMIAKFAEHEGGKKIKVDGKANSMGAFFLAFAEDVEALDISEIMIHRGAFHSFFEEREGFKDSEEFKSLARMNKFLRAGLEAKIDVAKFESITKVTLDEVFSMESRINVTLTASQAKQIGLINKVKKLTSEMKAEIHSNSVAMAASYGLDIPAIEAAVVEAVEDLDKNKNKNTNKMTIEKLKAENPEVFAQAVKLGVTQEKNRVEAILVFSEIDAKACKVAIESGEDLSQKFTAEMQLKAIKAATVAGAEEEGAADVDQDKDDPEKITAEAKKLAAFEKDLDENLKTKE